MHSLRDAGGMLWHMTASSVWKKLDLNLILVALLTVFAFAPLLRPGFFESHTGFLPVFGLFELEDDLWANWGWVPVVGRGSDLVRGEGPFPYVFAEFFRWLGFGGVAAIKSVYLLAFVASGLFAYLLAKKFYGKGGGLVAAVVYTYLPFHLATVYVRGALAEAVAFALYPLLLLCWENYLSNTARLWAGLGVLSYAALFLTNVGLAVLYGLFLCIYVVVVGRSRAVKGRALLALAVGVALGLVLFMPAVMRHGLLIETGGDFVHHFVYPFQLFSANWGYGASTADWQDTLPLQLGLAATGLTLLGAVLLLTTRVEDRLLFRRTAFFAAVALATSLLMLHPASFLWRASRLCVLLEYPWQLLAFVGVATSLASGSVAGLARQLGRFPWSAVIVAFVVVASYEYLDPRFTDVRVDDSPVAILGDEVALLGYEREGPLLHGATVRLTLHWQCLAPMETDYTVFVHIVDAKGTIWGQRDAIPMSGERPTSSWELGEIIEDEYELRIDVNGPREGYVVETGMYVRGSGERLPSSGGGTTVILE